MIVCNEEQMAVTGNHFCYFLKESGIIMSHLCNLSVDSASLSYLEKNAGPFPLVGGVFLKITKSF